jgi:aminoglycoside phosphotransferase family enzyme
MKRGIYLSVTPFTKRENSRISKAYSGVTTLLWEMDRFNQKTMDNCFPDEKYIQRLIDSVVAKNSLEL